MKGVCSITYIVLRSEPSGKAEQLSQIIYGETYEVLEERDQWYRVKCDFDGYEGWISIAQFFPFEEKYHGQSVVCNAFVPTKEIFLPAGATVRREMNGTRSIKAGRGNTFDICNLALQFLHTPYLWGGRTFMGIDCSGLVQVVFKVFGYDLPRDAHQQSQQGRNVSLRDAQPGDLSFFENPDGKVTHTGILLGSNKIIHSHGWVRTDKLDEHGIYNSEREIYTHKLHSIRRIIPD
jgi:hypothetical protein